MLGDKSIAKYLTELASAAPAPGGGAATALTAAQAAALLAMVCNLTLGKKKYAQVEEEVGQILSRTAQAQALSLQLAQEDADAFQRVMEFWSHSEGNEAMAVQKEKALQVAAEIPLRLFRVAQRLLPDATRLLVIGNKSVQSDVKVALYLLQATMRASLVNFEVNLGLMRSKNYGLEAKREMEDALRDDELAG